MKTIVLTGGGTAGHVTPNIALLPYLKENYNIEYIGSKNGIEKELIQKEGIPYHEISSGKLRRYIDIKNITDIKNVISGYFEAKKILKKLKPSIVFSKGGFVSVPVVIAASRLKIPVVIHDSDYTIGLANKISIPFSSHLCTSFKETSLNHKNSTWTGSPIRDSIFTGSRENAYKLCGFKNDKPTILFMGGSLGSKSINDALLSSLDELLKDFNVIHLCGKGKENKDINKLNYKSFEYVNDELPDIYAASDVIVSRAGSNSIFEFVALKKPNILIPLPLSQSRGDQILNAESFEKLNLSYVLLEENLNNESLLNAVNDVYKNKDNYINTMNNTESINGTKKIVEIINKYSK